MLCFIILTISKMKLLKTLNTIYKGKGHSLLCLQPCSRKYLTVLILCVILDTRLSHLTEERIIGANKNVIICPL